MNPTMLEPVAEHDPCGPDLRWNAEFLALIDAFNTAEAQGAASVVEGELVESARCAFDRVVDRAIALCARTKDVRVLAMYAQASWRQGGLVAFANAMEDLARVQEKWPGPEDGIHPRADESDGDLGERVATLGKLVNQVPMLAATIGWGARLDIAERSASAALLKGVFGVWDERLQDAYGDRLPCAKDAWRELQRLIGDVASPARARADAISADIPLPQAVDAWDLIDQAVVRLAEQDRHSPALPLLRLLSTWRSLGIIEIVDRMRGSGVTLEQLLESVKQQINSS